MRRSRQFSRRLSPTACEMRLIITLAIGSGSDEKAGIQLLFYNLVEFDGEHFLEWNIWCHV